MALNQGQTIDVTQTATTDGNQYIVPLGRQSEQLVSELHGKYYTQTYRGRLFHGQIASAAIPVTSATALTGATLWNKAGNTKNAVLVRIALGWVGTTEAPGNIQLAFAGSAGSTVATGALFTAYANAAPANGLLGTTSNNSASFGTSATLTAAMTNFLTLGLSHLTTTGTATFGSFTAIYDVDGMIIVPPGTAITLVASTATASTYTQTLTWYEAPI
jgi:hypothetical protein